MAEAALRSLDVHDSLSIDELPRFGEEHGNDRQIPRPFGPGTQAARNHTSRPRSSIATVGHYKLAAYSVLTITARRTAACSLTAFGVAELVPLSETEFVGSITQSHYTFVTDAQGATTGLMSNQEGIEVTWPASTTLHATRSKRSWRANSEQDAQCPAARAALRRLIEGVR